MKPNNNSVPFLHVCRCPSLSLSGSFCLSPVLGLCVCVCVCVWMYMRFRQPFKGLLLSNWLLSLSGSSQPITTQHHIQYLRNTHADIKYIGHEACYHKLELTSNSSKTQMYTTLLGWASTAVFWRLKAGIYSKRTNSLDLSWDLQKCLYVWMAHWREVNVGFWKGKKSSQQFP